MSIDYYQDIKKKLEYSLKRLKYLQGEISKAQKEDGEIEHLGIVAGEILSQCRECFDYAMEDARNNFADSFLKGRNTYFPFSSNSLHRLPIKEGSPDGRKIYDFLADMIKKIESQEDIPNTMTDYGIILTASKLVNEKKHISLLRTYDCPDRSMLFSSPIGSMQFSGLLAYDKKKHCYAPDGAPMAFTASKGASVNMVKGFLFSHNDADVDTFIMNYIRATQNVLSSFYLEVLAGEPIKLESDIGPVAAEPMSEEKKEAFDKIFPIFCRPVVIVIKSGSLKLLIYSFNMSGNFVGVQGEAKDLVSFAIHETIARHLRFMALRYVQGKAMRDMKAKIDDEWSKIKSYEPKSLRCFELHIEKIGSFDILSEQICVVKGADSIVAGFGMHFKTEDPKIEKIEGEAEIDRFWRAISNGVHSKMKFTHSEGGKLKELCVVTEKEVPPRKSYWAIGPMIKIPRK